jgi:hypothetical protein
MIYVSIFINSYIFISNPFEFYLGYLIYILLLPVFISRFGFSRELIGIFAILLLSGVFNIVIGNDTWALFLKVFVGLFLSYNFYYYVILEFNYDTELLFKWYLKGCYLAALIGIIQFISFQVGFEPGYNFTWIFNKWGYVVGGNFGLRINSIFAEPTHLGAVLSAAFFVSVNSLFRREPYGLTRFQSLTIIVVYLLSFSGLGQVGFFLTLLFLALNYGLIRYIAIAIPAGILLFNVMYNNVQEFRERYDGLVSLFGDGKFVLGKTHGSSFILYNNFHVALENFKSNFIFGSGVGSHPVAFEKYSIGKGIKTFGFNLNSADANSMLLRLASETGLFGLVIFTYIIFRFYVRRNEAVESNHWLISNSILVMILLNLFRQGHYFLNGFPFFVILYYYNWLSYQNLISDSVPAPTNQLATESGTD